MSGVGRKLRAVRLGVCGRNSRVLLIAVIRARPAAAPRADGIVSARPPQAASNGQAHQASGPKATVA